jgi:hypothetical protein
MRQNKAIAILLAALAVAGAKPAFAEDGKVAASSAGAQISSSPIGSATVTTSAAVAPAGTAPGMSPAIPFLPPDEQRKANYVYLAEKYVRLASKNPKAVIFRYEDMHTVTANGQKTVFICGTVNLEGDTSHEAVYHRYLSGGNLGSTEIEGRDQIFPVAWKNYCSGPGVSPFDIVDTYGQPVPVPPPGNEKK